MRKRRSSKGKFPSPSGLSDTKMLERVQRESFQYFLGETNTQNGLVADKTYAKSPSSIAAVGLALASYPAGVERGYVTRRAAALSILKALEFFESSPQGPEPDATGYKGFFYHFLDMKTGRRTWNCELSTMDTALFIAGALTAGAYFDHKDKTETQIRKLAEDLYRRIDWQWALNRGAAVTEGWKPKTGFLRYRYQGYDEAALLYILGLGSPTYPLPADSYRTWTSTFKWKKIYGRELLHAGPLFIHQLTHCWIDFRGIRDAFMRACGIDYFENSRRATYIQQEYAVRNPHEFGHYGRSCWGITASEGPGPSSRKIRGIQRKFFGYRARGAPYGPDDGTISPWAVVASLPFAPEIVLPTIRYFIEEIRLKDRQAYGFEASFNATFPEKTRNPFGWVSPYILGLNVGPMVLMIENFRSELIWRLTKKCPYFVRGLRRAGFSGGWLAEGAKHAPASGVKNVMARHAKA